MSEIASDQAAYALLAAAKDLGYDVDKLVEQATIGIVATQRYRRAEHPYVTESVQLIDKLLVEVLARPSYPS